MFVIIFLYILLPAIQIFLYLSNNFTFDVIEKVNFITSITALHWMLSNVLIASKVPLLQKIIPYDRRVKSHIIFSSGVLFLIIYHGLFKFLSGYHIGITTIPMGICFILLLFVSIIWIPVPGLVEFRKKLLDVPMFKVVTNYEFNKRLHVITQPILGILIYIHIYYSGLFYDVPFISKSIYYLLFIFSYSLFILSKTNVFKHKGTVASIDMVQDVLILDLELERPISYKSGQFTFLGYKNTKGVIEEHPFSFLSAGGEKSKVVSFGIKNLGDFTKSLSGLGVGDNVWIRGNYGNFKPKHKSTEPIILIGSGIGIVPLISIFKDLYNKNSTRDISIFIAVNNRDEILGFDILEQGCKELVNIKVNYLVYQEDGLLFSEDYFRSKIDKPSISSYYICSSPGVRNIVVKCLQTLDVKKSQIHYEAFSFS